MGQDEQKLFIVGVDGSPSSVEALRQAERIAGPLNARIEATACWDTPPILAEYQVQGIDDFEERVRQTVDEALATAFGPEVPGHLSVRLLRGNPRPALIEASRAADLLIVGRRGRGGFGGLLLGSVSSACISRAHCPVLVVRADGTDH
ncbi:universal stress protein [Arthrobacter rhombi]|uniref:universal stress protein n=1 Tax=Arthrobacter rhombi TaxID=71253 RepID=UPI0031DA1736